MTLSGIALLGLGLLISWLAGRFMGTGAGIVQGLAVSLCGVIAFIFGMGDLMAASVFWAFGVLIIFGTIGALLFRSGQIQRKRTS